MRFLSQVYTIARGSVGGITYTANQWHQLIARARTSPVQPGTIYQTGIRSAFSASDALWQGLTEEQRQAWLDFAQTCVYTGPLGNYTVPGRQLQIGTLALAQYANGYEPGKLINLVDTAPVSAGWYNVGDVRPIPYTGVSQGVAVEIVNADTDDGIAVIDVSIAFELSRLRYKGPWLSNAKTVDVTGQGTTTTYDIDRPLGTVGKAIFTRTRIFSASVDVAPDIPHRLSAVYYLRHICEVGPVAAGKATKKKASVSVP